MQIIHPNPGKQNIKQFFIAFFLFLFLFHNINSEIAECPKNKPIFKSGSCKLTFCSQEELNSLNCIIANSTIKTQWLNNIIEIGDLNFRYINFASYSNQDMVVQTTSFPASTKRMFYGIKENGRQFFIKDEKEISHYSIDIKNAPEDGQGIFEAVALIIKNSNEPNEYFMSVSKLENNAEIFNFTKNEIYYKTVGSFSSATVNSLRHAFIQINNNFYLFGFVGYTGSCSFFGCPSNKIYIQKHSFNSISRFSNEQTLKPGQKDINNAFGREVSCFQTTTTSRLIICFFMTKDSNIVKFNLYKINNDFSSDKTLTINSNIDDTNLFLKCIHLKDNVGVFVSYTQISGKNYPFFLFMEYKESENQFKEYLTFNSSKIILQKKIFNNNLLLNDIVNINDKKIAFSAPVEDKEKLYVVLFDIFDKNKIKIRYYLMEIFALYNYKILKDLRIHRYNNFIAFASSCCHIRNCSYDENPHYAALIIFSYPNSTDTTLYLEDYLNNNNIDPNNFEIDLKDQLKFENNIFGYVFSNIYIKKIEGPHPDYKSFSSINDEIEIKENYKLNKEENIIFKYTGSEGILLKLDKNIQYYFIVTEPDYDIYNTYPEEIDGNSGETDYQKEEYNGRLSYYNIKSDTEFKFKCSDVNCILCNKDNPNYCFSCRYNYTFSETNGKSCYGIETDLIIETTEIITEKLTEPITEKLTEPITEKLTEPITEKPTEPITEKLTEPITEKPTEPITEKPTEPITEKLTEPITEKPTELITEKPTEPLTQKPTEPITERPTEPITEKLTEPITERPTEPITEKPTEPITERPTEPITERPTEPITEKLTEPITEKPTEPITEKPTESITEKPTESITEKPTESITEKPTEPITEKPTEPITERPTEPITEKLTEKITEEMTEFITEKKVELKTEEIKNDCSIDNILNNKCDEGSVSEEQMEKLYDKIIEDYLHNYKGNNTIIQTQNVVFQISSLEEQKNSNNPNVSSIDLGECEEKLKKEFNISDDLIIFKTDIKSEDLTQTYVQYEIYDPNDLTPLNLSICKDTKISVSTPVNLDSKTSHLYDSLKEFGYDLFNENSAFYTDICTPYTSESGTDMTLEDRKKQIFGNSGNLSLCQSGCNLVSYNSTTKKANCICSPQVEVTKPTLSSSKDKFNVNELSDSFMTTLKNSNFLVLKCFKLAIDLKTLMTNTGRIFMTIILFLSLIMLITFCISGNKKIDIYLKSIIQYKIKNLNNNNEAKLKNKKNINVKTKMNKNVKTYKSNKNNKKNEKTKNKANKNKISNNKANNKKINKKNVAPPKKGITKFNKIKSNNKAKYKNENSMNSKINLKKDGLRNINNKKKMNINNGQNINIIKIGNFNIKNSSKKSKVEKKDKKDINKKKIQFNKGQNSKLKNYHSQRTSRENLNRKSYSEKNNNVKYNRIE